MRRWFTLLLFTVLFGVVKGQTDIPSVHFFNVYGPEGRISATDSTFEVSVFDEYHGSYMELTRFADAELYQFSFVHPGFFPDHPYCLSVATRDSVMEVHVLTWSENWRHVSLLLPFRSGVYALDLKTVPPDQRTVAPVRAQDFWRAE